MGLADAHLHFGAARIGRIDVGSTEAAKDVVARFGVIDERLSEITGPFPVPSPSDKRERKDDPGQKRRGHRYSAHPSNHTVAID
jgi:hypothetical protein